MRKVYALWAARNREYYRDKASLFWSFLVTPFIVVVLAVAFSSDNREILKVGVLTQAGTDTRVFSDDPAIERIDYRDSELAMQRISHHQLDMLIKPGAVLTYWINPESASGLLLEKLLKAETSDHLDRQEISGQKVRYIDWVIPGILAMNMMFSGLWGVGYVIVRYRKNGVLKRLQATPLKSWQFITAQGLSRVIIMLSVTCLVFVACDLFLDFMMNGSYLLLLFIALLGSLSIMSISLLMAARTASEELANGLLNVVSFPMLLLSELWFSLDSAPQWLIYVSKMLPLTHIVHAARAVMLEGAGLAAISTNLLVLVVTSVVFLLAASLSFRWQVE